MDKVALGRAIKGLRAAAGIQQEKLGTFAGYKAGKGAAVAISRIEAGATRVPGDKLRLIADALGVTVDEIELRAEQLSGASDPAGGGVGEYARRVAFGAQAVQNKREKDRIAQVVSARTNSVQAELQLDEQLLKRADAKFLVKLREASSRLEGAPGPSTPRVHIDSGGTDLSDAEFRDVSSALAGESLGSFLGKSAAGGIAGGAAGTGAAFATFGAVGLWGTASTGTAIGALSGVAATNATLAALGGGALSAGGLGIAGGTVVLGSIVAAPVLIAAGVTVAVAGRKVRKKAVSEIELIDQAWEEVAAAEPGYDAFILAEPQRRDLADDIVSTGSLLLRKWTQAIRPINRWVELSEAQKLSYRDVLDLAVQLMSISNIPLIALLEARDDELELLNTRIDAVLETARRQLEQVSVPSTL